MNHRAARASRGISCRPVSAAIASALALAGPATAVAATTWPVTSCTDGAAGSLRAVIAAGTTLSGDTVTLAALSCAGGKIALTSSSITIAQNSLTIIGPGKDVLQVDGAGLGDTGRVFNHTGSGTLDVRDLRITGGHVYRSGLGQAAAGGCIYSKAAVSLKNVRVDACEVVSLQDKAIGGAIYTKGALTIDQSTISGSSAYSVAPATNGATGGGIAAKGALTISKSTISGNSADAPQGWAFGGGAYSASNATMSSVEVSGNSSTSQSGGAFGGGLSVSGNLDFDYSVLSANTTSLVSMASGSSGGGARVGGNLSTKYSTIDANEANGPATQSGAAGLSVRGDVTLESTTISNNTTTGIGAALYATTNGAANDKVFLRNSTISGNHANWIGGISTSHKTVAIYNSTIAFNTAVSGVINTTTLSPGIQLGPFLQDIAAKFESSIVSNNTAAGIENDVAFSPAAYTVQVTVTNALIRASSVPLLPTNDACPLLGPLRDNGGLTKTHALMSGSPVIDLGDNVLINPNTVSPYGFDARGALVLNGEYDFVRVSGPAADMGAYELQKNDVRFASGFEGCAAVP